MVYEGGPAGLTEDVLHRIYPGLDAADARREASSGDEAMPRARDFQLEEA